MLVVLLTAALLALSSAQSADEDGQSTSDVQEQGKAQSIILACCSSVCVSVHCLIIYVL
ncbi:mCG118098, isoform CRA_b [Mus musculus]|nr:mCG118098, isoform CRA_b [Mus musculus]